MVCVSVTPSIVVVAVERTLYRPGASWAVVHDHAPELVSAVQVEPESVHDPVVASVSDVELAVAIESCTVAPTAAVPVKVSVRLDVMLSVVDAPMSDAVARSGVVTAGST